MAPFYREITQSDVGRSIFRAFGRAWQTSGFIGRITSLDVGKRVYLNGDELQVENDEQRAKRLGGRQMGLALVPSVPPPRPTLTSSAQAHFAKARELSKETQKKIDVMQGRDNPERNPERELARALSDIRDAAAKLPGLGMMQLPSALDALAEQIRFVTDSVEGQLDLIGRNKP